MTTRRPAARAALLIVALGSASGLACSGGDNPSSPSATATGIDGAGATDDRTEADRERASATSPDAGGTSGRPIADAIGGAGEALDAVGLGPKAFALEAALGTKAERVEVEGDTIHIYLSGRGFDPTMACIVAGGVLSAGERAVAHLDGESQPCD